MKVFIGIKEHNMNFIPITINALFPSSLNNKISKISNSIICQNQTTNNNSYYKIFSKIEKCYSIKILIVTDL